MLLLDGPESYKSQYCKMSEDGNTPEVAPMKMPGELCNDEGGGPGGWHSPTGTSCASTNGFPAKGGCCQAAGTPSGVCIDLDTKYCSTEGQAMAKKAPGSECAYQEECRGSCCLETNAQTGVCYDTDDTQFCSNDGKEENDAPCRG